MEKQISIWSYRLGLVCVVLTVVMRVLAMVGVFAGPATAAGASSIGYNTFLHGSILLLVLSIASNVVSGGQSKS